MYGECMDNNSKKAECVKTCADYDEGCWDAYCTDCRVKACQKKDWKKCCPEGCPSSCGRSRKAA